MVQSPMISCPLKQTSEIDWIQPLKDYIRSAYGDDPERYHEECATLNRLRQDMRGAGKDSASGRDLLYRYYGQLELLDLRFPVDENHIKISFIWFDAFTNKSTSQFSLAFEKASILFNISAVLSCHAANQNRADDTGLKTAYHSFQASAGMFTYINENFLHAPSTDLSRTTVKALISITLAQAQEVFLEKQTTDGKKPAFLAKLASQAGYLYSQAIDTAQEYVGKNIFDKTWVSMLQAKASHLASVASYYQAMADAESNSHGVAIARLQLAEKLSATAATWAKSFPSTIPASSNLAADAGTTIAELIKKHQTTVQETVASMIKDNDFIYHQPVPNEAGLSAVAKLPAAKAIPVSELYQGQDIQRIIGPDIFQKLVPMSVTESASLYDEEKAKLIRAETERVETANGEMAASLDYLKLPASLNILKGGMDQEVTVDEEFRKWCTEMAGHQGFHKTIDELQENKAIVIDMLGQCTRQLDMEESVCEKMRSKYGADWTQQPSSRLTATLRSDIRSLRDTTSEASASDTQLNATLKQYEADFDEMRSAGETDEADVLYQRAMIKAGSKQKSSRNGQTTPYSPSEGTLLDEVDDEVSMTVAEQIAKVEDLLKKLNLVKRERSQVLKDLKEKIHEDDITNVLILNKKSLGTGQEQQLFQTELEKFRAYQNRIIKSNHSQTSLMKDLTKTYGDLLQDKRVRSEQSKYETITRQRNTVMARYNKIYTAFKDLISGVSQAQNFYDEMRDTVENLRKNVETFVSNRRSEGAQLLNQIEQDKVNSASGQEDREREKLRQLMERLSTEPAVPSTSPTKQQRPVPSSKASSGTRSPPVPSPHYPSTTPAAPPPSQSPAPYGQYMPQTAMAGYYAPSFQQGAATPLSGGYNPMAYPYQTPVSPPPNQAYYHPGTSSTPVPYSGYPPSTGTPHPPAPSHTPQFIPPGYIPPPPPPRPSETQYPQSTGPYPSGPGGYAQVRPYGASQHHHKNSQSGPSPGNDPWAGLNAWK
ncbi:putative signal transduction protein BroA [Talaromyces proteolyticus]|uniref:BRO domain-containing protein 1 n=1 Tax=Talaromyces proteolyticus TaxID=1131652 RepID=A0AAD4KH37_9EURO|nr:putative signal transduction protein BroA [Talaromyces proteolyticus]KAH8691570.1 putative signal transduction protein BroA [Talaromyces proteolyticus]